VKSSKKQKGLILDSICMDTGLSGSRSKHLLARQASALPEYSGRCRKTGYGLDVAQVLEKIWAGVRRLRMILARIGAVFQA
jgi:hypothetical protein